MVAPPTTPARSEAARQRSAVYSAPVTLICESKLSAIEREGPIHQRLRIPSAHRTSSCARRRRIDSSCCCGWVRLTRAKLLATPMAIANATPQSRRLEGVSHQLLGSVAAGRPRTHPSSAHSPSQWQHPELGAASEVRVAAVQISGYDKGDLPRPGYDPVAQLLPFIHRAGQDAVSLVVFPEYILGHIRVPSPSTARIAAAAKAAGVYVIVGCWEVVASETLRNTALLFDRAGEIVGRYHKTHAAVDSWNESQHPWTAPPAGKSRDWLLANDPEWVMERGQDLPVFVLDNGLRVGVMTCYDGWFPETARELSLRGAECIVWINGRGGSVEDFIIQTNMFQSHVAMVATNQAYGAGTMIGGVRAQSDVPKVSPPAVSPHLHATYFLPITRRS